MKTILILLLPTVISAQISIEITLASDNNDGLVYANGKEQATVDTIDIKTFHLTNNEVIENLKKIGYKKPSNITKDLNIVLKPVNARITRKSERTERFRQKYINNNSGAFKEPDVNQRFEETLRTRWYETQDISVGRKIDIRTSNDRVNLTSAWGQDNYVSKNIKVDNDVVIPFTHTHNISSVIRATLASTEIRVDYEATLQGKLFFQDVCDCFICIRACFESHELEINEYFHRLNTFRRSIEAHQIIDIRHYRNFQVTVTDMPNGFLLYSGKLEIEGV